MKINFVGSFGSGYVGEVADETHLCNELEALGHKVHRIPRDIWRGHCLRETPGTDWPMITDNIKADINIVCKWPHFDSADFINILRHRSEAPVFYWVWDYMWDQGVPPWNLEMAKAADLYLSNEAGVFAKYYQDVKAYYFPFDVADKKFDKVPVLNQPYNVTFFGSYLGQGDRVQWLRKIQEQVDVKIFSWNHEEWKKIGFMDAEPAVYGEEFAKKVAQSKIILGFNVNDHCWGYWSNRVGKVLCCGGFLMYRFTPGMELFLRDGVEYFSSPDEAVKKIKYYLEHKHERDLIANKGYKIARERMTSHQRIKDLVILMERYLKGAFNEPQVVE